MRVSICAVGRLRAGPERVLLDDYLSRFHRTGRNLGLSFGDMIEVEDKRGGGKAAEAHLLQKALPSASLSVALDERGQVMTSPKFSQYLATQRDDGCSDLVFVLGGADGLHASVLEQASLSLSFGAMVWPHMLARVMLAEQLYRAASILSGSPYHRA